MTCRQADCASYTQALGVREALLDESPACRKRLDRCVRAARPAEVVDGGDRPRIEAGDVNGLLTHARLVSAYIRRRDDARHASDSRAGRRRVGLSVLRVEDVVARDLVLEPIAIGRLQTGAERGHQRDQREADHQRTSRTSCPPRVAHRVLTRKPAHRSPESLGRDTNQTGKWLHNTGSAQTDGDEEPEGADGQREAGPGGAQAREQAKDQQQCRDREGNHGRPAAVALETRLRQRRTFADRRDRRHVRGATRR